MLIKDEQGRIIPEKEDLEQFLAKHKATSITRQMEVCLALERAFIDEWGLYLRGLFPYHGASLEIKYDFAKSSIRSAWSVLFDACDSLKHEFKDNGIHVLFEAFSWMQEDMNTIFLNWHGLWKKSQREFGPIYERKPGEDFHGKEIYF